MNYDDILAIGGLTLATGLVVLALEELRASAWMAAFYNWSNGRLGIVRSISSIQMLAALSFIAAQFMELGVAVEILILGALLALLLLKWRVMSAQDGADRMYLIVVSAFFTWEIFVGSGSSAQVWGVYPFALILGLAYLDSGRSKIVREHWRTGRQLALIFNSKEFGNAQVARVLLPRKKLCFLLSWVVILVELTAIVPLMLGGIFLYIVAPILILMHAGIAVFMGLGRFFYPFTAGALFVVGAG